MIALTLKSKISLRKSTKSFQIKFSSHQTQKKSTEQLMTTFQESLQLNPIKLMMKQSDLLKPCKNSKSPRKEKNKKFMLACYIAYLMNTDSFTDILSNSLKKLLKSLGLLSSIESLMVLSKTLHLNSLMKLSGEKANAKSLV